jgi:uncharacterized protein YebE (UPF0316 family)
LSFFIISPEIYSWVFLPLLIFVARIFDVSLETIRVIYISKGIKYLAPIIAVFEIVIWLLAVEVVMSNLSNIANFLAFAFGFAMGTYVGLVIEERLSIGRVIVRIISSGSSKNSLMEFLTASNYGVTCLDAKGTRRDVTIILTLVNRSDLPSLIYHIEQQYPDSFYSIEDIRSANGGCSVLKAGQSLQAV